MSTAHTRRRCGTAAGLAGFRAPADAAAPGRHGAEAPRWPVCLAGWTGPEAPPRVPGSRVVARFRLKGARAEWALLDVRGQPFCLRRLGDGPWLLVPAPKRGRAP